MNANRETLLATVVCAALFGAGCNNPNDNVASGDMRNTPPTVAPVPPASSAGDRVAVAIDDTALTAKVKAALIAEPGLQSLPIDVSTKQSVVTLSGAVGTAVEKAKALQVAENIQGVKSVVDNLVAKS